MEQAINTNNLVVDIDCVTPNEYNPKVHYEEDEHNFHEYEKIKESIQKVGQIQPILVREIGKDRYEIINGFHRWSAMKELGFSQVEIKNLGKLTFDEALSRALLTEDTKVPIDKVELGKLFKEIVTIEKPIEYWADLLPYTPDLIKQQVELLDFDPDMYESEGGEGSGGEEDKELKFFFKLDDYDEAETCNTALAHTGFDTNEAFVEVCRYYLSMHKDKESE